MPSTPAESDVPDALAAIDRRLVAAFPIRGCDDAIELAPFGTFEGYRVAGAVGTGEGIVSVHLSLVSLASGHAFSSSLRLMEASELFDPRRDALVDGWVAALQKILVRKTPPADRFCFAAIDVRMPMDVVALPIAAKYEAAFLEEKWLGALLPAAERTPRADAFDRAPRKAVTRDGAIDVPAMMNWVWRHAKPRFVDPSLDRACIDALPVAARHLWYASTMEGAVHNGGVASFVLQAPAYEIEGSIAACRALGASLLARVLEAGVVLGAAAGAQFVQRDDVYRREKSKAWRAGFVRGDATSLDELDGHEEGRSFWLLENELPERLRAWVTAHEGELVASGAPVRGSVVRRRKSA